MTEDYSAEFIYKPPQSGEFAEKLPLRFLTDKFVVNLRESEEYCADCEAQSHYAILQQINTNDDVFINMKKIKDALCFVLENVEWTVNDGEK